MRGKEDSGALIAAATDEDVAGASEVAPQTAVDGGQFGGGFVPFASSYAHGPIAVVAPYQGGGPPLFYMHPKNCQRGSSQYLPPAGGYGVGGKGNTLQGGCTPATPFSNRVKIYAN